MKLEDRGMVLDAGDLGNFVLQPPFLMGKSGRLVHPLAQKQIAGNTARLKYEGGCEIEMELRQGGEIHLQFSNLPDDVAFFEFDAILELSIYEGGVWRVGSEEPRPFPREKPDKPTLLDSRASEIMVQNKRGTEFSLHLPEESYVRLIDNRDRKSNSVKLRAYSRVSATSTSQSVRVSIALAKNE